MSSGKEYTVNTEMDILELMEDLYDKDVYLIDDHTLLVPAYIESIKEEKEIKA